MNTKTMISQLRKKFSEQSLKQSVWLHTQRTASLEEMDAQELELFYYLFFPKPLSAAEIIVKQQEQAHLKILRGIVLNDAQYTGYHDPNNWDVFNRWMLTKSPYKKPLKYYTADELEVLIRQFKSIRTKFDKRKTIVGTPEFYREIGTTKN